MMQDTTLVGMHAAWRSFDNCVVLDIVLCMEEKRALEV